MLLLRQVIKANGFESNAGMRTTGITGCQLVEASANSRQVLSRDDFSFRQILLQISNFVTVTGGFPITHLHKIHTWKMHTLG